MQWALAQDTFLHRKRLHEAVGGWLVAPGWHLECW